jgi:gamma-glutamyltranspeptidase/glutathione hydrolase
MNRRSGFPALVFAAFVLATPVPHAVAAGDPEGETVRTPKPEVVTHKRMVVAANPLAAAAGEEMLAAGGAAADAAIAAQLVLTLVEPQSSGLGGGGFLVYFDRKTGKLTVYDGRETAPAADRPDLFLGPDGQPMDFLRAEVGGRPVGVPGIVRLLEAVHKDHGKLAWKRLFEPAIRLADGGFPVTPRLHNWLDRAKSFLEPSPALKAQFYHPDGTPLMTGETYRDPALGATLRRIAADGAAAFYEGPLAREMVEAVRKGTDLEGKPNPGGLSLHDLATYRVVKREAVCGLYRVYRICGAGPPSAGTVGVLEILGMLQPFDMKTLGPDNPRALHLFAEASRRAFADRDAYLADPAFVAVPVKGLLDPDYLVARSMTIDPDRVTSQQVSPGDPPGRRADAAPPDPRESAGTSHLSVVDGAGDAIAFTTTVNGPFGSHLMAGGFILNNQLTDFSFLPQRGGEAVANRVEPGKRPRSSMAPLIVFDADRHLRLIIGSPGGPKIIDYVALATIAHLDWGLGIQQAVNYGNVVNTGTRTELEAGTRVAGFAEPLRAMGHQVEVMSETSGLHAIAILPDGLHGGADERREGVALGK